MKKTFCSTYTSLFLIGLLTVTSCEKSFHATDEQINKEDESPVKVFNASIESNDESKTTLGENNFVNWINGDQISINGAIYEAARDEDKPTRAIFTYVSGTEPTDSYEAYYPVRLYNDYNTPTLPSEYQYNSENPFKDYPMYATSNTTSLAFKNICALLKIVVPTGKTIKKVIVSSNKNLSGPFTIGEDGETIIMKEDDEDEDGDSDYKFVTLDCGAGASAGSILYVAIPPYDYTNLCVRIQLGNDTEVTKMVTRRIERNKMYSITIPEPALIPYPSGSLLSGEFSVSATKKVRFSKGNLQAEIDASGKATKWKFATKQYEYIGNKAANTSIGTASGTMDLFGIATDCGTRPWGINISVNTKHYSMNFVDWGENIDLIKELGSGWRTLSGGPEGEWNYLIKVRNNASKLHKRVTICDQPKCLVIAPDGYTGSIADSYDANTWSIAESDGLVCFPLAGSRQGNEVTNLSATDGVGVYWSSTPHDEGSFYTLYNSIPWSYNPSSSNTRYNGRSVRLVQDSN